MTNPVHLIVSPNNHSNLGRAIGEVHRRYTRMINFREKWRGYLLDAQSQTIEGFAKHERTGRPLGSDSFIEMAESLLIRGLKKKKPGPKVLDDDN